MEFDRCVQVRLYPADGSGQFFGSGYAVGPRLVLTAAHVLGDSATCADPGRVTVAAAPGLGRPVREFTASVVWYRKDTNVDAALVLVDDADWVVPESLLEVAARPPQRWGRMIGHRPHPVAVVGFPRMQKDPDTAARPPRKLDGALDPTNASIDGRWEIAGTDPTRDPFPHEGAGTRWSGMSGAAVLADAPEGSLLCGVTRHDLQAEGGTILTATPTELLVADHDFRRVVTEHSGGWAPQPEPVEPAHLLAPAARNRDLHSPASLLRADAEAVAFHGRDTETAQLLTWCCTPPAALSVHLLIGAGGEGKSRLARHLAQLLDADGWIAGHLHHSLTDDNPPAGYAGLDTGMPLLLVVDYAETRPAMVRRLVEHLSSSRHRARLLLLARTDGPWRTDALGATPGAHARLQAAQVMVLGPLLARAAASEVDSAGDPPTPESGFAAAAAEFARLLPHLPDLPPYDWPGVAKTVTASGADLGGGRFGNALTLQMAALTALLQQGPTPVAAAVGTPVEQILLDHEQRYWHRSADTPAYRLDFATTALDMAVAVAALCGSANRDEAAAVLATAPDIPPDKTAAACRWLAQLYPAGPERYWGSLQPDRVAEYHASHIVLQGELPLPAILDAATPAQQAQILTVLARAAVAHHNHQRSRIGELLVKTVDDALDTVTLHPDAVRAATLALPYPAHNLSALAVRLATTQVDHDRHVALQDPAFEPDLARSLSNLGVDLSDAGRRAEALAAEEEALAIRRRLAAANPEVFEPALALSLSNVGVWLSEVGGRWGEALAATEEATRRYRDLAAADPAAFEGALARSLSNLGMRLSEAGRRAQALAASEEAVARHRALVPTNPVEFEPDFAWSLSGLSARLSEAGRWGEALAAEQEAVVIWRRLAVVNPAAFEPGFATSLTQLGVSLSEVGRWGEAVLAADEAVVRYRGLAAANPGAFGPALAWSLSNLGMRLSEVGRWSEALAADQEAVESRRRLAAENPAAFEPALALSLINLGMRLSEVGRWDEALAAEEEAVEIRRRLAAANPVGFEPDLAGALSNLGVSLSEMGRKREALVAGEEAVAIRRRLAVADPAAFAADLALSLSNLAAWLSEVGGRWGEAAAVGEEAVVLWRRLVAVNPQAFEPALARSLTNLGVQLSELGRWSDALAAGEESVLLHRRLADGIPGVFEAALARSLSCFAGRLSELGRWSEALVAEQEAVGIRRRLAAASPAAFGPAFADSLSNLGVSLAETGRWGEALAVTEEAVVLLRRWAAGNPAAHEPELARALANLAGRLSEMGRWDEALAAEAESLGIRRRLMAVDPAAIEPDLARSLSNLGNWLSEVGRCGEALAAEQEAVGIRRRLAAVNPAAFEPDLAASLSNLAIRLSEAGDRRSEVLAAEEEAVGIRRRLVAVNPAAFERDLARSLSNFGFYLSGVRRWGEALAAEEEAVALYRRLAEARPAACASDLAETLCNLAVALTGLGRQGEARVAEDEAEAIRRGLDGTAEDGDG